MTSAELKPCPFCGNEPFVEIIRKGHAICGCSNANDCPANPEAWGRSRPKAIAAWNTRANYGKIPQLPNPSEPLVERVARAIWDTPQDQPDGLRPYTWKMNMSWDEARRCAENALAALPAPEQP